MSCDWNSVLEGRVKIVDLYSLSSSIPCLQDAVCLSREMFLVFCLERFFLFVLLRTLDHPRLRERWGRSGEAVFVPLGPPVGGPC